jgi:hypothetical protein
MFWQAKRLRIATGVTNIPSRCRLTVSEATAPFSRLLDVQSVYAGAQCHGMSSSIRLWGQPLTRRVSKSVR